MKSILICLVCAIASVTRCAQGKYVEGHIKTLEDWIFVSRFCFLSEFGRYEYYIEYERKYGDLQLLLYYDEPNQWHAIYKTGKVHFAMLVFCLTTNWFSHFADLPGKTVGVERGGQSNRHSVCTRALPSQEWLHSAQCKCNAATKERSDNHCEATNVKASGRHRFHILRSVSKDYDAIATVFVDDGHVR